MGQSSISMVRKGRNIKQYRISVEDKIIINCLLNKVLFRVLRFTKAGYLTF